MKKQEVTLENREKGASLVEYALLVALIAVVAFSAVQYFGESLSYKFSYISSSIEGI